MDYSDAITFMRDTVRAAPSRVMFGFNACRLAAKQNLALACTRFSPQAAKTFNSRQLTDNPLLVGFQERRHIGTRTSGGLQNLDAVDADAHAELASNG